MKRGCVMKKKRIRILLLLMAGVLLIGTKPVYAQMDSITVSFRLIGDGYHKNGVEGHSAYMDWIPTTVYTVESGSTMCDIFVKAIEEHGLRQKGAAYGYVEAVRAPAVLGEYWLYEFDNGPNSGWMYTVNGVHPGIGLTNYELKNGDQIVWHYVDDYVQEERDSGSAYYERWLETEDITPEEYLWKSYRLDKGAGGNYIFSSAALPENLLILAAGYRVSGQMTACQLLKRADFLWEAGYAAEKELTVSGAVVKVFVLDAETYALKKVLEG